MYYAEIKRNDIANGEGIRVSVFVSGCRNACKNCFNREAWDFSYGSPFTSEVEEEIFKALAPSYVAGLTLLGGEPMEPENQRGLLPFIREFKRRFPSKTLWLFTGNLYEELIGKIDGSPKHLDITEELLSYVDILVDGRFIEEQKSLGIRFRGSRNQRIIDMNKTRAAGDVVIWDGCREDKEYSNAYKN